MEAKHSLNGLGMGPASQDFVGGWAETMRRLRRFPREVITDFQSSRRAWKKPQWDFLGCPELASLILLGPSQLTVSRDSVIIFGENKEHLDVLSSVSTPFVTLQTLTLSSPWSSLLQRVLPGLFGPGFLLFLSRFRPHL